MIEHKETPAKTLRHSLRFSIEEVRDALLLYANSKRHELDFELPGSPASVSLHKGDRPDDHDSASLAWNVPQE